MAPRRRGSGRRNPQVEEASDGPEPARGPRRPTPTIWAAMSRVFSGVQPSGDLHLGNYLGALRRFVEEQYKDEAFFCVVDLHAMTIPHDPQLLRGRTAELAASYLAVGLDPDVCTLFVQSQVHEHSELAWILQCNVSMGELRR